MLIDERDRPPRILIDCDPGHDDAVMLVLAAVHTDVVGITTVNGNVPLDRVTENCLGITELLDWDVPVAAGADRPLIAPPIDAAEVHGESGMDGVRLPATNRTARTDGIEFLIESVRAEEGLWIVATAPLTNVALALRTAPDLETRLAGICLMGGSATEGNVTAAAEFNVHADPEAAAIVFGARCPVRMCGLDLTRRVTADRSLADRLRSIGGPAAVMVAEVVEAQLGTFATYAATTDAPPLHDPVALLALTHPHLFESVRAPIRVETAGHESRGATIVDRRLSRPGGPDPADGVTTEWVRSVDAEGAIEAIVDACRRWAPGAGPGRSGTR